MGDVRMTESSAGNAANLGSAMRSLGLGTVNRDLVQPRVIAAVWARLFLLTTIATISVLLFLFEWL